MTDSSSPTEETGAVPIEQPGAVSKQSPRAYLNSARRNLSEDELRSPGAIRLLISESDRLEDRCASLEVTAAAYHDLRVEKAVLEAKSRASKWHEVLSGICLATGSAGIGVSFRLLALDTASGTGVLIVSVLLVLIGIASKVWK
jgi:hypothetical protein